MKTLVTGSDGLIGSAIRNLGLKDCYFATRKDADLQNFDQTLSLFSKVKPKRVIHLAALVGGIEGNSVNPANYFMGNIQINVNTLEAARLSGVERLVSFMSTCVFPDQVEYPLTPSSLHSGPPHPSNFGYAYSKRMLEVQTRAYRLQWGLNFSIAIPANVYGPHDNFDLKYGHVVPSLIRKVYDSKIHNKPLEVWGTGESLREFIYSEDIARLAIWMLDNYQNHEPLILSSGKEISIRNLVDLIVDLMNFPGQVFFDASKPHGQHRKHSDASVLKQLNPEFNFIPIAKGLSETINWFESNYPTIRGLRYGA